MPRDIPPEDLAESLRTAAFHLRMALRIVHEGDLSADGLPGYRDRMAALGAGLAGAQELAQVWPWVVRQPDEFNLAFRDLRWLRPSIRGGGQPSAEDLLAAVRGIEVMLRAVDAKLEEMNRG